MKLNLYKTKFFLCIILTFLFFCQTSLVRQKRFINGSKSKYELVTPNIIKIYSLKNSNLMKEGEVKTDCPKNICVQDTIKNLSLSKIESFLKNKEGPWTEYVYKDGKRFLKRKGGYRKNKKEGTWKVYVQKKMDDKKWKNFLSKEIDYRENKKNGPWKLFREDGKILKTGIYLDGLKENEEFKYSSKNEKIESKIYKRGKLNGEYWKEKPQKERGFYKDGLKEGIWTYYYKDNKIKKTVFYKKDKLDGLEKSYYPNGKLKSEGKNLNNHKTGVWKFYYSNAVKQSEGKYQYDSVKKKSLRTGIWKEYYKNGELFATGYRKHTQKGKWTFYFANPKKQKAAEGEMVTEFTMSEGIIYSKQGMILGKGKFQFSIFRISPDGSSLKNKYRPGVPFTYYKEGKKEFEILTDDKAIEYRKGKKYGEGTILTGTTKKNGCWNFTDGKKIYYINNKENKRMGKLQNCK